MVVAAAAGAIVVVFVVVVVVRVAVVVVVVVAARCLDRKNSSRRLAQPNYLDDRWPWLAALLGSREGLVLVKKVGLAQLCCFNCE